MANMTVENIGQFINTGNTEIITERGRQIQAPEVPTADGAQGVTKTFGELLSKNLNELNEIELQADRAINELNAGRNKNIHETMLTLEKADMSFKLAMQVRNKVIDAYREIMRMQV